jgi:YgiT-type zinc finger domain-containing protein
MKCVICKHGETEDGFSTVTLESAGTTLLIKRVPAQICNNCGEEYLDDSIVAELLKSAEEATRRGVELDVRHYLMAA